MTFLNGYFRDPSLPVDKAATYMLTLNLFLDVQTRRCLYIIDVSLELQNLK